MIWTEEKKGTILINKRFEAKKEGNFNYTFKSKPFLCIPWGSREKGARAWSLRGKRPINIALISLRKREREILEALIR